MYDGITKNNLRENKKMINLKIKLEELKKEIKKLFSDTKKEHQELLTKMETEKDAEKKEFLNNTSQEAVDNIQKAQEDLEDCSERLRKAHNLKAFLEEFGTEEEYNKRMGSK